MSHCVQNQCYLNQRKATLFSNFRSPALFQWGRYTELYEAARIKLIRNPCIFTQTFKVLYIRKKSPCLIKQDTIL